MHHCHTQAQLKAARAAGRLYAEDHDQSWHPSLDDIMIEHRWCLEMARAFVEECRSQMRRFGRKPESRTTRKFDGSPFRS